MRTKKVKKGPSRDRWLISYSDFMTLLMIFFVIMYSMSNIDSEKYKKMTTSMGQAMGTSVTEGADSTGVIPLDIAGGNNIGLTDLQSIKKQIDSYIKDNNLSSQISTETSDKGLIISLKDSILFDSGKSDLRPESEANLSKLGDILKQTKSFMRIEGHTDNIPIHTTEFKSNWQLSTERAITVLQLLVNDGYIKPEKVCAIGYGEYRPIASNDTESGRNKNRRVDIILVDEKYQNIEK